MLKQALPPGVLPHLLALSFVPVIRSPRSPKSGHARSKFLKEPKNMHRASLSDQMLEGQFPAGRCIHRRWLCAKLGRCA